jgi:hypothetical protein
MHKNKKNVLKQATKAIIGTPLDPLNHNTGCAKLNFGTLNNLKKSHTLNWKKGVFVFFAHIMGFIFLVFFVIFLLAYITFISEAISKTLFFL